VNLIGASGPGNAAAVVGLVASAALTAALWWWGAFRLTAGHEVAIATAIGAVLGTSVIAGILFSWSMSVARDEKRTIQNTWEAVLEARTAFEATIRQARIATAGSTAESIDEPAVAEVLAQFDELEQELRAKQPESVDRLDAIADKAAALRRARANFMAPRTAILHSGKAALDDMREWGVPQTSLARVTSELVPLLASPKVADARAALIALLQLHDDWDPYATWYNSFMGRTAGALLMVLLLVISGAAAASRDGKLLTAFALAGIGGAALSVLSKLPPLAAYGEATQYLFRVLSRVGTGFAASLIGAGLLSTGVLTVTIPAGGTFGEVVAECSAHPPIHPRMIAAPVLSARDTAANTAPKSPGTAASDATQTNELPSCGTNQILFLLALAMILGFSERALTTFEDRVFPPGTLVPVPVAAGDQTSGGGQGGGGGGGTDGGGTDKRGNEKTDVERTADAVRQAREGAEKARAVTAAAAVEAKVAESVAQRAVRHEQQEQQAVEKNADAAAHAGDAHESGSDQLAPPTRGIPAEGEDKKTDNDDSGS
jgi:hypothetical protein